MRDQWKTRLRAGRSRRQGWSRPTIWLAVLTIWVVVAAARTMGVVRPTTTNLPQVIGPSSYAAAPRNCTQARALGLRNIPRSSPFYASWLDADDDGIACETWRGR